jgi:type I restriction enzyme S subunit
VTRAILPFDLRTPSGWEVQPFGRVVKRSQEAGRPDGRPLSVYLDQGVVPRDSRDDNFNRLGADLAKYLVVQQGDIVFNKLRTWQGGLGVSKFEGIVSPAYFVCRPRASAESRFLHYLLRSRVYLEELTRISKWMPPSQFDIAWEDLRSLPVALPAKPTQRAIADFLDRETAQIDALVVAKRRIVELTEERWVATLTNTISPLWATDLILNGQKANVPPQWSVRKLGSLTRPGVSIAYGILLPGERLNEGVPYLGAGDVRTDRMKLDLLPRTRPEIAAAYPRTFVRAGELVYAIRGSFGAVEQVPAELDGVNLSRDAARIAPGEVVNPRWLMFALKSELAQEQFRRREVGATITGVNIEDLKTVRLAVPPLGEQSRQVVILDAVQQRVVATISVLESQLHLLSEHRHALITAAVTGEMEVPGTIA